MNKSTLDNIETLINIKCSELFEKCKRERIDAEDLDAIANLLEAYRSADVWQQMIDGNDKHTKALNIN